MEVPVRVVFETTRTDDLIRLIEESCRVAIDSGPKEIVYFAIGLLALIQEQHDTEWKMTTDRPTRFTDLTSC